jgi:purine-binding chemotaxis protein CheW
MAVHHDNSTQREGDVRQLVTMHVDGQLVGLPIRSVQDVFTVERITPVPRAAASVLGLVNLRGRVVTLLSLRSLLGLPAEPFQTGMMAVGVDWKDEAFGLVIDQIGDVLTVNLNEQDSSFGMLDPRLAHMAVAIHKLDDGLIVELSAEALFATPLNKAA